MSIVDKIRGLGLGLFIWILAIPILLFTIFPLVSCTSSSTSGIYLVSLLWNTDDKTWLRIGYYGLCLTTGSSSTCASTSEATAKQIGKHWDTTTKNDITAIKFAMKLQDDVFVAFMTAGGVDWLISLILATLVILKGSSSGFILRTAARVTAVTAAMLMFASAWATTSASQALAAVITGGFHHGRLLQALQWIAAILSFAHAYLVTTVAAAEHVSAKSGSNNYPMS